MSGTQHLGEFTWYSRLAVWAGALVLLVQSITGRSTGVMTLVGVILLAGGFAAFLSGLAFEGRRALEASVDAALPHPEPTEVAPAATPGEEPLPESSTHVPAGQVAEPAPVPAYPVAVPVEEVSSESPLCGVICPRCRQDIAVRQMAALCPVCGAAHHGACWIENRFHCSTPGCRGHGNLVEPGEAAGE